MISQNTPADSRDQPSVNDAAEQIAGLVLSRLRQAPYSDLKRVSCDLHEGILTLRGRVPSFYLKQVAQTVVKTVDGVLQIDNRIEVGSE